MHCVLRFEFEHQTTSQSSCASAGEDRHKTNVRGVCCVDAVQDRKATARIGMIDRRSIGRYENRQIAVGRVVCAASEIPTVAEVGAMQGVVAPRSTGGARRDARRRSVDFRNIGAGVSDPFARGRCRSVSNLIDADWRIGAGRDVWRGGLRSPTSGSMRESCHR